MTLARPVALTGFMASGKSTVGRALAVRLGVPFEDTDELIERSAGRSVQQLFADEGEPAFRARERAVLEAALGDPSPRVLALGGGALLDRGIRLDALRAWTVACLRVSPEETVLRAAGSGRPLLRGPDPRAAVDRLLREREDGYAEAHVVLDGQTAVETLVDRLASLAARPPLVVALGARTYRVEVGPGAGPLGLLLEALRPTKVLGVTDGHVDGLIPADVRTAAGGMFHVTPPGELAKTIESLTAAWERAGAIELDRRGVVVGIGGGAVTDLAGFLAGTWMRGVRWVAMPTTLLAMVDAAVGGKTAVDLGAVKNVVGVFHQPSGVVADPAFCATESARAFASGLAEVVKSALVGDVRLLELLEQQTDAVLARDPAVLMDVIRSAAGVKTDVVSRDEREGGLRAVLNLGHTLGHGLEAEGGLTRWTHGEAVGLGTLAALRVGQKLGVTDAGLTERVSLLLQRLGLPVAVEAAEVRAATAWIGRDKKRDGAAVKYVLVERPGLARVVPLPLADLQKLLVDDA